MSALKKRLFCFLSVLGLLLLTSCDLGPAKLETVVFNLIAPLGTTNTIRLDYNAKGNIQVLTQEIQILIPLSDYDNNYFAEVITFEEKLFKEIHGTDYSARLTDQQFSQTLTITIKDVTNLNLANLFNDAYHNGKISLADFSECLIELGFEEQR